MNQTNLGLLISVSSNGRVIIVTRRRYVSCTKGGDVYVVMASQGEGSEDSEDSEGSEGSGDGEGSEGSDSSEGSDGSEHTYLHICILFLLCSLTRR